MSDILVPARGPQAQFKVSENHEKQSCNTKHLNDDKSFPLNAVRTIRTKNNHFW